MNDRTALESAIASLDAQRALIGDAVVDAALAPLRARLAALQAPAPEQQLKQATVLFVDIVGSTRLSQELDPEDVHALMDGALAQFTAIAQAHRGRVLQYAGDSMLAVFGAETASEDDPEHAVRAGLALLAEGARQGELIRARYGQAGFDVRVGIHTGPVLLGGGVDSESSVRGLTVNVAARMEQTAPPGALRISHDTYRHVRGVFDVEAQLPILVKGRDAPLITYLVQRAKPRAFRIASRGVEGVETPLVGRQAELAALTGAFETLLAERSLLAITLVSEAGLGKSRLLAEFQNTLEMHTQPFWLLLGRSQPHSALQAYGLVRDLLAWRFQITDGDSAELARKKLVDGMTPVFADGDELPAHLLGHLIGLDFSASPLLQNMLADGRQLRDRAFQAGAQLLRRLAARDGSPLVMLLEDLHWADDGSLDFLRYLLQQHRDLPMLLVMLARPALFERRSAWTESDARHQRIDLAPLGAEASGRLSEALLYRMGEVPAALQSLLTSGAEGNPFYMEELLRMLIDDGVIATEGERWQVRADRFLTARVPGTLTGVLQARLDALAPAERSALQHASVIGHVFWDAALAALQSGAPEALPAQLRKELIVRRNGSAFGDAAEYAFQHQMLQQVTYDTVLKAQRRAGHAAAAAWLAERLGERAGEYLAVAADHYERAGDDEQALVYFERAADHAISRYANGAALAHFARMLANPRFTDARRRASVLLKQSACADRLGDRAAQRAALDERLSLAEQLGDDSLRAGAKVSLALLADRLGDHPAALLLAREAWQLAERAGDAESAALALGEIAWVHCARVQLDEARRHAELGLAWARRGAQGVESQLLVVAAEISKVGADYAQAEEQLRQALVCSAVARDARRIATSILITRSDLALQVGDWPAAQTHAEAAVHAARDIGVALNEAGALRHLSDACAAQGDSVAALAHGRAAFDIHHRVGDRRSQTGDLIGEGDALCVAEEWPQALAAFERAVALAASISAESMGRRAQVRAAGVHVRQGENARALAAIEGVLGFPDIEAWFAIDLETALRCHRILAAAHDPRAPGVIERAHAALQALVARIADEATRSRVLNNLPHHREIVAAWQALESSTAQLN
jgi:class 3 adenylate cyclase/tetratricopeptide (TPR) repeat protein